MPGMDEPGGLHPFDRYTNPVDKNNIDPDGKYSWSTAVRHSENGRLEAGLSHGNWLQVAVTANLGNIPIL